MLAGHPKLTVLTPSFLALQLRQLAVVAVKQTVLPVQRVVQAAAVRVMLVQAVQAHRVKEVMVVRVAELMAAVAVAHLLLVLQAAYQVGKVAQDQHRPSQVLLSLMQAVAAAAVVLRQAVQVAAVQVEPDLQLAQRVLQTQAAAVVVAVLIPTLLAHLAVQA